MTWNLELINILLKKNLYSFTTFMHFASLNDAVFFVRTPQELQSTLVFADVILFPPSCLVLHYIDYFNL